jgi:hypothetical protein
MALYCPLLSRFRQATFPQIVDKPVGKLFSYPMLQAVQSGREADRLNNQQ